MASQSEFMDEMDYGEDQGVSQTEGGIEEDDLDEKFPKIGSSDEDAEQKQRALEYLQIVKEINGQNRTIEEIKARIIELCAKPCKTCVEERDIRQLRACMEQENLKLQCLINKAVQLQNFGSHRRWQDLPVVTTFDEDNLRPYVSCTSPRKYKKSESSDAPSVPCVCQEFFKKKQKKKPDSDCDEEKHIRMVVKALKKLNITCPEDKKLVNEIAQVLCSKKNGASSPCSPVRKPCPPPCPPYPCPPCKQKQRSTVRRSKSDPCQDGSMSDEVIEQLKQKVNCMQSSVNRLKQEICKRERERQEQGAGEDTASCNIEADAIMECGGKKLTKSEQIEKLKESYCYLLTEFSKKEAQLKTLKIKAEASGINTSDGKKTDDAELCLLKARISELKEEQQEFKCIMKEQSQQLEDYRNKYLSAQQKVEEQCVLLEKLNMNNKRIEKQINCEVKEIRAKFQEKLSDLLQLPKLLENEQLKVAELNKEKEDLEKKLVLVCKELNAMRENERPKNEKDLGPELEKCQAELEKLRKTVCELEKQRALCCQQLRTTQDDLDTLRTESAKIIARTKERTELIRLQQQECINKLEKELAQCRATACLSVSDREAVIREMQGQLNTLSFSFDAAQKQIKTLRNHIAYVSNENCYPVKCQ